jgi:hypothetical protein
MDNNCFVKEVIKQGLILKYNLKFNTFCLITVNFVKSIFIVLHIVLKIVFYFVI